MMEEPFFMNPQLRTFFQKVQAQPIDAFNPATVSGLMCRNTLSVGWDGRLFDCDFNQMLNLEVGERCSSNIHQFNAASLAGRASAVTPTTSST